MGITKLQINLQSLLADADVSAAINEFVKEVIDQVHEWDREIEEERKTCPIHLSLERLKKRFEESLMDPSVALYEPHFFGRIAVAFAEETAGMSRAEIDDAITKSDGLRLLDQARSIEAALFYQEKLKEIQDIEMDWASPEESTFGQYLSAAEHCSNFFSNQMAFEAMWELSQEFRDVGALAGFWEK